MKMYDLDSRYRACVFAEYATILSAWERQVDLSVMRRAEKENKKPEELYAALTERERKRLRIRALETVIQGNLASCGDLNSWKYALYRALEYGEQELAAWLDENEEHVRTVAKRCEVEFEKQAEKAAKILEDEEAARKTAEDAYVAPPGAEDSEDNKKLVEKS